MNLACNPIGDRYTPSTTRLIPYQSDGVALPRFLLEAPLAPTERLLLSALSVHPKITAASQPPPLVFAFA